MFTIYLILFASSLIPSNCFNIDDNYIQILAPKDATNFGYSVALGRESVFVGSPNSLKNGVLYKCGGRQECEEYVTDGDADRYTQCEENQSNHHRFGASIAFHNGTIIACAPNWYICNRDAYSVTGICLQSAVGNESNLKILKNTIKYQDNTHTYHGVLKYKYAFAVFGVSIYVHDNGDVLIGAPGAVNAGGTIFLNDIDLLNDFYEKEPSGQDFYIGYSLLSGIFADNDETLYIAGAPRYGLDKSGEVIVTNGKGSIKQHISSDLPFSYFGSSMATAKINGVDRRLIVGAPTCLQDKNEYGCVLIYNYANHHFQLMKTHVGTVKNMRYGTAIVNLGKVNYDEFDDVAVGAPADDDGVGAVYIYFGSSTEDWSTYQKLTPKLYNSTVGFGFSLSNGEDYDGNGLNDIAVGCVNNSKAYLFLSRKTIQLQATLTTSISEITTETEFRVEYCMRTNYKDHGIKSVSVKLKYFVDEYRITNANVNDEKFVIKNGNSCKKIRVKLVEEIENRNKKLNLQINYTYVDDCHQSKNNLCPIESRHNKNYAQKNLTIVDECGYDKVCDFDYDFAANLDEAPIVHGKNNTLIIKMTTTNNGPEMMPSFKLRITSPSHPLKPRTGSDFEWTKDGNSVVGNYGNKLKPNKQFSTAIKLSVENLHVNHPSVILDLVMSSGDKNQTARLTKEIVRDYNIMVYDLNANNDTILQYPDHIIVRKLTIVNGGLTKEAADASLTLEYNPIELRTVTVNASMWCSHDVSKFTCQLNGLSKTEFSIIEDYDYELFLRNEIVTNKYRLVVTVDKRIWFSEDFENRVEVFITKMPLIVAASVIGALLIALIIGSIIVGVLWKRGFFKRKFNKEEKEAGDNLPSHMDGMSEYEDGQISSEDEHNL